MERSAGLSPPLLLLLLGEAHASRPKPPGLSSDVHLSPTEPNRTTCMDLSQQHRLTALLAQKHQLKFPQGVPQISSCGHGGGSQPNLDGFQTSLVLLLLILFLLIIIIALLFYLLLDAQGRWGGGSSSPHRRVGMQLRVSILLSSRSACAHARPHLFRFLTFSAPQTVKLTDILYTVRLLPDQAI